MYLKKIFSFFLLFLLLTSLVESSISYSTDVNFGVAVLEKELNLINNDQNEHINDIIDQNEENNGIIEEQTEEKKEDIEDNLVNESDKTEEEPIVEDVVEVIEFNIAPLQLREGIVSDEVFRIRKYLELKGYTDLGEGYYFDSNLNKAVIDFQKANNLNPDGIIGPKTFSAINEDMKTSLININYYEIELPEDVPKGKWILINKGSNTLYHYDNRELINKYPIATGKTPEYTPEGKFYIATKFVNPYWGGAGRFKPIKGGAPNNPLGKRWLGLSIKGGGTYGIHGNSDVNSIGKYVSLGCIRMYNEDIEYLFDIVEYNTPVWIIRDLTSVGQ
ncbi:MAG: L,D-transpeptidase family protein [Tissierellaceae bacterium]|nr:L,D-transpeptidase family protein [Tissierellaceae bacterium]